MIVQRYLGYISSLVREGSPLRLAVETLGDCLGKRHPVHTNKKHVDSAMHWLLCAQSANRDGGVSALYSLYRGWDPSYSETTGYIIPTLFNYYRATGDERIRLAAIRMAEWELTKQFPSGAFPGGSGEHECPTVFNTGQVLFGMVSAYRETKENKYLIAIRKAADWLSLVQEKERYWKKHEYLGKKHVYNSRVAWPLLLAFGITKHRAHKQSAIKFLDWAVMQQKESGWYANNAFYEGQEPLLHTIAYAIQGIFESGIILKNKDYVLSAKKAADPLLGKIRADGSLPGSFDEEWNSSVSWSCLTGNAQMAVVWLSLYRHTKEKKYLEGAQHAIRFLKSTQNTSSSHPGICGGIKGAHPIWGWYAPFCYINWGAKFYIDALMFQENPELWNKMS